MDQVLVTNLQEKIIRFDFDYIEALGESTRY